MFCKLNLEEIQKRISLPFISISKKYVTKKEKICLHVFQNWL